MNNTEIMTENTAQSTEIKSISIIDMVKIAITNWWVLALAGVICAVAFFTYSKVTSVPAYRAEGSLYIDTQRDHINDNVDASAILQAQDLIPTYIEILESRTFNKVISEQIDNKYTYEELSGMISFNQQNATNILVVSTLSFDEDDAYMICKAVLDSASDAILRVFEGGLVRVIDYPENEPKVVVVSLAQRAIIGFILGAVIAFAIILLLTMFDTRVSSVEELSDRYSYPVLGEIPSLKRTGKYGYKKKGGYGYEY